MDDTDEDLLRMLIKEFDRAMLVSRCGDSMRARPTTVANTGDTKRLWLLSGIVGDSLDELRADPNVNVVMQDGVRFCSVSGTARVARPSGDEPLWNERQRAWLAHGSRRSSLVLIEVAPQFAEYWDRSGLRGLRFASEPPPGFQTERDTPAPRSFGGAASREHSRLAREPGDVPNNVRNNVIILEQARWKRS